MRIMVADIKRAVAAHYRIPAAVMSEPMPVGKLHNPRNPRKFSHPRAVAMCLARRLTDHSLSRIGQFFGGRDHSTVWEAVRRVETREREALRRLTKQLLIETRMGL